jgi:hypothetical protein
MLNADRFIDLLHGARSAFADARRAAWDEKIGDAPIEEDQLFWLIDIALPALESSWSTTLRGSGVSMRLSGVFCHKTPMALYPNGRPGGPEIRRELGDLLLVHDHHGRDPHRRAVLMQAKRMEDGKLKADNPEQARLYSDWPPFQLRGYGEDGTAFLTGQRDFSASRDGIRYLLFEDSLHPSRISHLCCSCDWPWCDWDHVDGWLVSDPRGAVGVPGSEDLATTFVNMLYAVHPPRGQRTKRHLPNASLTLGTGEDFDVTVQEILNKTFSKDLKTTKRGRHARKRGERTSFIGTAPLAFVTDSPLSRQASAIGTGAGTPVGDHIDEEESRPMAVILIETSRD